MIARRTMLMGATALASAPALGRAAFAATMPPADPYLHPGGIRTLGEFDYDQVQLLDGPALSQREMTMAVVQTVPEDSLLKTFRRQAKLPAPGLDMGGWYDSNPLGGGGIFGQWVSGLSRYAKATGSAPAKAKVARLMDQYALTIAGDGGMLGVPTFDSAYFYDKIVCGCVDAAGHAGYGKAWPLLARVTDLVHPKLPEKALTRKEQAARKMRSPTDEYYTVPENQFLAWRRSGDARYKAIGRQFLMDEQYFDPLARNENVLPGLHAYSHVNALSSGLQAYLSLGEEKYLTAVRNAFRMIEEQSWASGGWGPGEFFIEPGSGELAETLFRNFKSSFETVCGAYAHFKLTRTLLRITRDPHYGDSMERVFYNTILGALPMLADGTSFYYSDYKLFTGKKVYYNSKWPCCAGTFPQVVNDYAISAYLHDAEGVYVNLYLPSRVAWTQGKAKVILEQKTDYPVASTSAMTLTCSSPTAFALRLRVPGWAKGGAAIKVNGAPAGVAADAGSFAVIERTWKTGDTIEIDTPMTVRLQPIDEQHPNLCALLRGPLVLHAIGQQTAIPRAAFDTLKQVSSGPPQWTLEATAGTLRLRPFMYIHDEEYVTYMGVS